MCSGSRIASCLEKGSAAQVRAAHPLVGQQLGTGALHDPASMLAKLGVTGPVWLTMINGRVVYRDDHLTGVDEAKLLQEGEQVCTRVLRDTCEAFAPYRRNPQ